MTQTLDITVSIPSDYVLIKRTEWDEAVSQKLVGRQWTMKDLEAHTNRSNNWLKENVLYPYRNELDIAQGGFVRYPVVTGKPWRFSALDMANWLEENKRRVL